MKFHVFIAALILVLAALLGLINSRELATVTKSHRALTQEATALGLSIGQDIGESKVLLTKRPRENRTAEASLVAKDFIAFALEMQAAKRNGEQPNEATHKRNAELGDRVHSLDPGQLETLIAEFRTSTEMDDETRTSMLNFAVTTLANDHPEAALTLLTGSQASVS